MFVCLMVALCRAMLPPSDFPSRTSACPPCGLSSWISASRWCTIGIRPAAVFTCQSVTHDTMCSRWVVLRGIFISYATTKAAVDAFNVANRWRKRGISLVWTLCRGFTLQQWWIGCSRAFVIMWSVLPPPPPPRSLLSTTSTTLVSGTGPPSFAFTSTALSRSLQVRCVQWEGVPLLPAPRLVEAGAFGSLVGFRCTSNHPLHSRL